MKIKRRVCRFPFGGYLVVIYQGGAMAKMDGARQANVFGFPAIKSEIPAEKPERRTWFFNRLVDLGLIAMNDESPKPPGFYINGTSVVGFLIIGAIIAGLFFYTYWAAYQSAYQKGLDDAEKKAILERLNKAEQDVKKAKELQLYNNGALEEKKEKK